ncbi:hypothetical protein ES703_118506 [subsurface metagenome]
MLIQDKMLLHAIHGEFGFLPLDSGKDNIGEAGMAMYLNDVLIRKYMYSSDRTGTIGKMNYWKTVIDESNLYIPFSPDDRFKINLYVCIIEDALVTDTLTFTFFKEK